MGTKEFSVADSLIDRELGVCFVGLGGACRKLDVEKVCVASGSNVESETTMQVPDLNVVQATLI